MKKSLVSFVILLLAISVSGQSQTCSSCGGSGQCNSCYGGVDRENCSRCGGSGRCWRCYGTGRVAGDLLDAIGDGLKGQSRSASGANNAATYIVIDGKKYKKSQGNKKFTVRMPQQGKHKVVYENGDTYVGFFRNGKQHGKGTYTSEGNLVITGTYVNGILNGKGKIVYANGSSYEGDFKGGDFDGHGTLIDSYGTYVGEFKQGRKHGYGTLTGTNKFVGTFSDDYFVDGTIYKYNGDKYEGTMDLNGFIKGKYTYADGRVYEGEYWRDFPKGQGVMLFPNGDKYVGRIGTDGLAWGEGRYYWKNGDEYRGEFKKGQKWGKGRKYNTDFTYVEGTWNADGIILGTYKKGQWKYNEVSEKVVVK